MRTLDEAWFRFRDNTKASIVVTKTTRNYQPSKMARAPHPIVPVLTRAIRATIAEPTPESVRDLKAAIDGLFECFIVLSGLMSASALRLDAMSALGWVGKATLFLCAGDVARANDAGRNTLDAVARVVILTGNSRDDLSALLTEVQG
jgi:hypothetical protein